MARRAGWIRRGWEWISHLSVVAWLLDVAKAIAGPAVGALTILKGLGTIPLPYLVASSAVAAGATMWLVNQLTAYINRFRQGYSYGLAYEGVHLGLNPNNADACLQLGFFIRNVTDRPIQYDVTRFDVVVGSTTLANPTFLSSGGFIPRGTRRHYSYPSFKKAQVKSLIGKTVEGAITFEVEYGHPDSYAVRRLKMKLDITLNLDLNGKPGVIDAILKESDEAI